MNSRDLNILETTLGGFTFDSWKFLHSPSRAERKKNLLWVLPCTSLMDFFGFFWPIYPGHSENHAGWGDYVRSRVKRKCFV